MDLFNSLPMLPGLRSAASQGHVGVSQVLNEGRQARRGHVARDDGHGLLCVLPLLFLNETIQDETPVPSAILYIALHRDRGVHHLRKAIAHLAEHLVALRLIVHDDIASLPELASVHVMCQGTA